MRWYIAGPLFTPKEREHIEEVAGEIAKITDVFIPHKEEMLVEDLVEEFRKEECAHNALGLVNYLIFCSDVYHLVSRCNGVVLLMDGRVPDEGAVAEAAIAWTLGMPVIGYKTDTRSLFRGQDNPFITGLLTAQVDNTLDLTKHILSFDPNDYRIDEKLRWHKLSPNTAQVNFIGEQLARCPKDNPQEYVRFVFQSAAYRGHDANKTAMAQALLRYFYGGDRAGLGRETR